MRVVKLAVLSVLLVFIAMSTQIGVVQAETKATDATPWSGWWWPYTAGGLSTGNGYRGRPAPLEKYSMLQGKIGRTGIIQWYENKYYDPTAPYWYGLCYAWAAAASFENEPLYPSSVDNIIFRVGDKKGLLTFAHLQDFIENESCNDDPAVLHYWLLHYIGEMGRAFVADLDAGEEVWSHPIYKYDMQIIDSGQTSRVEVELFYANDFVKPDYVGIDGYSKSYEYELYKDSDGIITGGQWLAGSVVSHPDFLTYVVAANCNYNGDGYDYQLVRKLAASQDDYMEKDGTVLITPGSYSLILLNEDVYGLNTAVGELIWLDLSKSDDSDEAINYAMYDADKRVVTSGILDSADEHVKIELEAVNPPYQYVLTQENYDSANIYQLTFARRMTRFQYNLPYFPKNGMWTGVAITNPNVDAVNNVCLVGYDAAGVPIATLWGPAKIEGHTKKLLNINNLHCFMSDWLKIERLHLLAGNELAVVALSGAGEEALSEIGKPIGSGTHLVIPDTSSMTAQEYVRGGVCSSSAENQKIDISVYNSTGRMVNEKLSVNLDPGEKLKLDSSIFFGDLPNDGWVDVRVGEMEHINNPGLEGYLSWRLDLQAADMMRGLQVASTPLWLINLPASGFWKTTLILINVENEGSIFHIVAENANESQDIYAGPHQRIEVDLFALFAVVEPEVLVKSTFKISSEAQFVGYVNYQGDADYVSLPLINEDSMTSVLTMPHLAAGAGWWTGVCVFNPHPEVVAIKIVPVHADGSVNEAETREVPISALGRIIFSPMSFWESETAADLSFLTIESVSGNTIGGFFLYGNQYNGSQLKSLAGSNM